MSLDVSLMPISECFSLAQRLGEAMEGLDEAMDPEKLKKQNAQLAKMKKKQAADSEPSGEVSPEVSAALSGGKKSNFFAPKAPPTAHAAAPSPTAAPRPRVDLDGTPIAPAKATEKPSEKPKTPEKPAAKSSEKAAKAVFAKKGSASGAVKSAIKAVQTAKHPKSWLKPAAAAKAAGEKAVAAKKAAPKKAMGKGAVKATGKAADKAPVKPPKFKKSPKTPAEHPTDKEFGANGEKNQRFAAGDKKAFGGHAGKKEAPAGKSTSPHSPFHKFSKLGDESPRHHTHDEADKWHCSGSEDKQVCVGIGDNVAADGTPHHKVVHKWKHKEAYQHEYKKGIAKGRYIPGWRSGNTGDSEKQYKTAKKFTREKPKETHHRHNAGRSQVAAGHKGWADVTPGTAPGPQVSPKSPHDEKIYHGVRSGEVHPDYKTHLKNMAAKVKKVGKKAGKQGAKASKKDKAPEANK